MWGDREVLLALSLLPTLGRQEEAASDFSYFGGCGGGGGSRRSRSYASARSQLPKAGRGPQIQGPLAPTSRLSRLLWMGSPSAVLEPQILPKDPQKGPVPVVATDGVLAIPKGSPIPTHLPGRKTQSQVRIIWPKFTQSVAFHCCHQICQGSSACHLYPAALGGGDKALPLGSCFSQQSAHIRPQPYTSFKEAVESP